MNHSTEQHAHPTDTVSAETTPSPQRFDLSDASSRELTEAFADAVSSGDAQGLRSLLGDLIIPLLFESQFS